MASSSSSTNAAAVPFTTRKPFYPVWPETHDEAEYYEIPPDHFLAQQRGPQKPRASSPSLISQNRRNLVSSVGSVSTFVSPHAQQPLSELADAIRSGIPAFPLPTANPAPSQPQNFTDAISRPAPFSEALVEQMPDTSTLAAADFDVDVRSGFLPPEAPVTRLVGSHEKLWEKALDQAKKIPLMQGGGGVRITPEQRRQARRWRRSLRETVVLPLSEELATDIRFARRGHLVLSFLAHFYIHSQLPAAPDAVPARSWRSYFSRRDTEEAKDEQDLADELSGKFSRTIPAAIAVPWVQLSQKLDLPPVLTYATTVLWNWAYIDPSKGLALDNLRMLDTFSKTKSEEHFYITSLYIEARGVEALQLMRVSLDEAFVGDRLARRRITHYLKRLAVVIGDLKQLLHDVRTDCDPTVFYWGIRPWFRGSDAAENGEAAGWHFEGVDPVDVRRSFSGPSAGQSSLIHSLDVFLDVDHTGRKSRISRPSAASTTMNEREAVQADTRGADATFMERMQLYMPGHHRNFLNHLRNISFDEDHEDEVEQAAASDPDSTAEDGEEADEGVTVERPPPELSHPIRSLALAAQKDGFEEGLPAAYDLVLGALKGLRDEHMRIAYLYIVSQTRTSPPPEYAPLPTGFTGETELDERRNKAQGKLKVSNEAEEAKSQSGAKGTGGTDLVSFLKDCRTNTTAALITAGSVARDTVQAAISAAAPSSPNTPAPRPTEAPASSSSQPASSSSQSLNGQSHTSKELGKPSLDVNADSSSDPSPPLRLQVWAINVAGWEPEASAFSQLVSSLLYASPEDREKIQRYYRQIDKTRSLAARLFPRLMYAKHYGVPWETTRFTTSREGRPSLSSPSLENPTDFNISHDSDWVVLAFHAPGPRPSAPSTDAAATRLGTAPISPSPLRVGIDVMQVTLPKFEDNVRTFCETMDMALTRAERTWVLSTPDEKESLARLFDLWTYKEAFTKNVGKGLGFDFSTIQIAFDELTSSSRECRSTEEGQSILKIRGEEEEAYRFTEIKMSDGAQLVVAEGPFVDKLDGSPQVSPPYSHTDAIKGSLLTVWSMQDLINMSKELFE